VINPIKGYVVSANNFITTDKASFGISHSMVFPHRAVRIAEMIELLIKENKAGVRHMKAL